MTADSQVSKHMFSQPNTIYPKEKVLLYFLVFTERQDVTKPAFFTRVSDLIARYPGNNIQNNEQPQLMVKAGK